ncbi:MAG: hypothetical protein HY521_06885 [Proteobacteria bacterium]|nr:hypothetical protein [Pseudomonadota bacterium]
MAESRRKPRRVREPLSEQEEFFGKPYYSAGGIDAILQSFEPKNGLDRPEFIKRLEKAAWWFVELANARPDAPPSMRERECKTLRSLAEKLLSKMGNLGVRGSSGLAYAAEAIAKARNELPDFEPELVEHPPSPGDPQKLPVKVPIWPVEKQVAKSTAELEWLRDVFAEAARRAGVEKAAPGNRPFEPKAVLFRVLHQAYWTAAASPQRPWRRDDQYGGEELRFFRAALTPLGVKDSDAAIYDSFGRFVKPVEELRRSARRRPRG